MALPKDEFRGDLKDALLREKIVTQDVFNEILGEQEKTGEPLLEILMRSAKFEERKFVSLLNREYGYASINPAVFLIDREILELIPRDLAEKYCVLPISRHEQTLTVAFANPTNVKAIDEIHLVAKLRIRAAVAEVSLLRKCIQQYYDDDPSLAGSISAPEEGELEELAKVIDLEQREDMPQGEDLLKIAYQTPVIKLVNMLLMESVRRHASDIFMEPWENHVRVRARVDGLLEEIIRPQKSVGPALVSRIKVMSGLNIAEHRIPQDGRFKAKISGREVDMRVSILPTTHGEKVCLRILDTSAQGHDIAKLGFNDKEQGIIKDSARKPHGMILVTGPTGSGKTTTLYSVLKYLDSPEVNITTVEDPVEYQLPGINQVNVKEQIGLTFPASLRSILRQDPDIILIGEIRDNVTLDIAVKAALTGHLVLSTLHTNDAASSVTRMVNMGLEPFLIASTVLMISAQRLVRRLCPRCQYAEEFEDSFLVSWGLDPKKCKTFYKGRGCIQCRQTGYQGRTVITEIVEITPEIRQLIMEGASAEKLKTEAHRHGMTTLRESAIQKAIARETSLEEVFRVTGEDQKMENDLNLREALKTQSGRREAA